MSSNNLLSFPEGLYLTCQKRDRVKEQKPVQWAARMYPAMACLRAERWKLLSWALQAQGWPKSFPISIKQRQLATRNFSSHRINIGAPRNNLLVGIEAPKIILWPVNPKFSANPQLDTIRKVSESVSVPNQYKNNVSWFLPPVASSVPFHLFHQSYSCYTFTMVQRGLTYRIIGYLLIGQGSSCLVTPPLHHWLDKLFTGATIPTW